jgi:hypothetical protein
MPVEERRRVALHNQIAAAWGEEAADTLFDLITPAGHELATRADIEDLRREMHVGFTGVESTLESMEHRLSAGFERRMADAVSMQTRTLVFSQLGALLVIAALAFGLR